MTRPTLLIERARRAPDVDLCVVPGSTAVVAFGDPVTARVATIGMNPSAGEFRDGTGSLLAGADRRLATLESLGIERYGQLTDEHAGAIVDNCVSYFDRRPSETFEPVNEVVERALGASYRGRSASHLNLVQWATSPGWGELPAEDQDERIERPDSQGLNIGVPEERVVVLHDGPVRGDLLAHLARVVVADLVPQSHEPQRVAALDPLN
jgi:hypothetical protein